MESSQTSALCENNGSEKTTHKIAAYLSAANFRKLLSREGIRLVFEKDSSQREVNNGLKNDMEDESDSITWEFVEACTTAFIDALTTKKTKQVPSVKIGTYEDFERIYEGLISMRRERMINISELSHGAFVTYLQDCYQKLFFTALKPDKPGEEPERDDDEVVFAVRDTPNNKPRVYAIQRHMWAALILSVVFSGGWRTTVTNFEQVPSFILGLTHKIDFFPRECIIHTIFPQVSVDAIKTWAVTCDAIDAWCLKTGDFPLAFVLEQLKFIFHDSPDLFERTKTQVAANETRNSARNPVAYRGLTGRSYAAMVTSIKCLTGEEVSQLAKTRGYVAACVLAFHLVGCLRNADEFDQRVLVTIPTEVLCRVMISWLSIKRSALTAKNVIPGGLYENIRKLVSLKKDIPFPSAERAILMWMSRCFWGETAFKGTAIDDLRRVASIIALYDHMISCLSDTHLSLKEFGCRYVLVDSPYIPPSGWRASFISRSKQIGRVIAIADAIMTNVFVSGPAAPASPTAKSLFSFRPGPRRFGFRSKEIAPVVDRVLVAPAPKTGKTNSSESLERDTAADSVGEDVSKGPTEEEEKDIFTTLMPFDECNTNTRKFHGAPTRQNARPSSSGTPLNDHLGSVTVELQKTSASAVIQSVEVAQGRLYGGAMTQDLLCPNDTHEGNRLRFWTWPTSGGTIVTMPKEDYLLMQLALYVKYVEESLANERVASRNPIWINPDLIIAAFLGAGPFKGLHSDISTGAAVSILRALTIRNFQDESHHFLCDWIPKDGAPVIHSQHFEANIVKDIITLCCRSGTDLMGPCVFDLARSGKHGGTKRNSTLCRQHEKPARRARKSNQGTKSSKDSSSDTESKVHSKHRKASGTKRKREGSAPKKTPVKRSGGSKNKEPEELEMDDAESFEHRDGSDNERKEHPSTTQPPRRKRARTGSKSSEKKPKEARDVEQDDDEPTDDECLEELDIPQDDLLSIDWLRDSRACLFLHVLYILSTAGLRWAVSESLIAFVEGKTKGKIPHPSTPGLPCVNMTSKEQQKFLLTSICLLFTEGKKGVRPSDMPMLLAHIRPMVFSAKKLKKGASEAQASENAWINKECCPIYTPQYTRFAECGNKPWNAWANENEAKTRYYEKWLSDRNAEYEKELGGSEQSEDDATTYTQEKSPKDFSLEGSISMFVSVVMDFCRKDNTLSGRWKNIEKAYGANSKASSFRETKSSVYEDRVVFWESYRQKPDIIEALPSRIQLPSKNKFYVDYDNDADAKTLPYARQLMIPFAGDVCNLFFLSRADNDALANVVLPGLYELSRNEPKINKGLEAQKEDSRKGPNPPTSGSNPQGSNSRTKPKHPRKPTNPKKMKL